MKDTIVCVFPSRKILMRALDYLSEQQLVSIEQMAIVARNPQGETIILDDDLGRHEGGWVGTIMGAGLAFVGVVALGVFTLSFFQSLIVIATSILIGGVIGTIIGQTVSTMIQNRFPKEQVQALAEHLTSGHPALVLRINNAEESLNVLRDELKAFRAERIEPMFRAITQSDTDNK